VTPGRSVAASADVGSPELAAALEAGDPVAVGRALQTGWVVVPVTRSSDRTELRLFAGLDADRPGWELPLFSSVETLHAFLADDPARDFEFVFGPSLAATLADGGSTVTRVVFDPAGPHPAAADAGEVREILAAAPVPAPVPTGIRAHDRALDLELPLGDDWLRIDLTAVAGERERQISAIVDRQLAGLTVGPTLRTQLVQWLRRLARTAEGGGGRETAFLVRRTDEAALALSATRYWSRLGPPPAAGSHLDTLAARLAARATGGDLVSAELATGRLVRDVRVDEGDARVGGDGIPVLAIDYWLEFPDRRGLCLVSFSAPYLDLGEAGDLRDVLLALTDEIIVASTWLVAAPDPATEGRGDIGAHP